MDRHLQIVANAFYLGSAILAIPGIAGFLIAVVQWLRGFALPATSPEVPRNADNMLKLIDGAARIAAAPFRLLAWAGQWVMLIVAIVSVLVLIMAVILFFTGRGLHLNQIWAKYSASIFLFALCSSWFSSSVALRKSPLLLIPLSGAAACVYGLWALWRRPI